MNNKIINTLIGIFFTLLLVYGEAMVVITVFKNEKKLRLDEWIIEGGAVIILQTILTVWVIRIIWEEYFKKNK